MKFFKQIVVTALAMYLLSIIACRHDDRVEVIPGGLNSTGLAEPVKTDEIAFDTNGLIGFRGFNVL